MAMPSFFRQVVIDEKAYPVLKRVLSKKTLKSKTKPVFIKEISIEDFRKAYGK